MKTLKYPTITKRQNTILNAVLEMYTSEAKAVSSQQVARSLDLDISPATVRVELSALEEMGLLTHLHTSAGRIPTTHGYSYYVDSLLRKYDLSRRDRFAISTALEQTISGGLKEMLKRLSVELSRLSSMVSIVLAPELEKGILRRLDLVRIASGRLLVVLTIESGIVKTVMMDISSDLKDDEIRHVESLLNERLSGLRLHEIRKTVGDRLSSTSVSDSKLLRMIVDFAGNIFEQESSKDVHVGQTKHMLDQPEFSDVRTLRAIMELLDDSNWVVELFEKASHEISDGVLVAIGEELGLERLSECSVVTSSYTIGDSKGKVGIIGPMRMDYSRQAALVNFAAESISKHW